MIYGLYLSAAGMMNSAYQQDVIANNLANSETTGFKRDLALVMQRKAEAQKTTGGAGLSGATMEKIGGGIFAAPTAIDSSQGDVETTGNPTDVAILGKGYFAAETAGKKYLTRAGNFTVSNNQLCLADGNQEKVLGQDLNPIAVDPKFPVRIDTQGTVTQGGKVMGKLALLDADPTTLTKNGANLLASSQDLSTLAAGSGTIRDNCLEKSNVDPSMELNRLMECQRQLEANANMIRYQDETMKTLVNDVGRVS